jgi:hypothetical protein
MVWLTLEQFLKMFDKCSRCDRKAKWISQDAASPSYCDEHYPYSDDAIDLKAEYDQNNNLMNQCEDNIVIEHTDEGVIFHF